MINIVNKTCIYPNCLIRPVYNYENEKIGIYCNQHKLEGMINIKDPVCKTYLCMKRVGKKYDGYCMRCYMYLFPDKPISLNYKTKESAVIEYIKSKISNFDWKTDKIIAGGCSKRRPDLLLDLGYQIIIIEIDENQHIDYDCSCENKRIMEISQDLSHRPIIFIRFNPDSYFDNGVNITSCWGINGNGICVIKKSKRNEWNERLEMLKEQVNYWINPLNITNKTIDVIQMYYDK